MQQKKSINFGFRGWMLILYQAIAFLTFVAFTNYPLNLLADMYGGPELISTLYTTATIGGIVIQLIMANYIGKLKSIKKMSILLGVISLVLAAGVMLIPPFMPVLWQIVYFLEVLFVVLWCTFSIGILVGQWFPRRKGTIMGIATLSFPIANALLGVFAANVFKTGAPDVVGAFLPFMILAIVGLLIGLVFIKDYPEQVGAYRDNDKSITPEIGKAMMEQEIINKKTSVWTVSKTLRSPEYWFIALPIGLLLMTSVGIMTQTVTIIGTFADQLAPIGGFQGVMIFIAILTCFCSWLIGVLDTKFGTRKVIVVAVIAMILSGFIGSVYNVGCLLVALACLCVFLGAASNFPVSASAQYWRREDFPNVFTILNPIVNIIQAIGPMIVAMLLFSKGYTFAFTAIGILGVISLILILLFKPIALKARDDKYREAAGKALDDELASRK